MNVPNLCPNSTQKTLIYERLIIKTHWHVLTHNNHFKAHSLILWVVSNPQSSSQVPVTYIYEEKLDRCLVCFPPERTARQCFLSWYEVSKCSDGKLWSPQSLRRFCAHFIFCKQDPFCYFKILFQDFRTTTVFFLNGAFGGSLLFYVLVKWSCSKEKSILLTQQSTPTSSTHGS